MSAKPKKIEEVKKSNQEANKKHYQGYYERYKEHQGPLTAKLDKYNAPFDENVINEITLWKVNRYPIIKQALLDELNKMREVNDLNAAQEYKHVIKALLKCYGVGMPMASTYLRFLKPDVFQIIDVRAYRALTGDVLKLSRDPVEQYFGYLQSLRKKCDELSIDFKNADRIFYRFDIEENKDFKIDGKKTKRAESKENIK